MKILQHCHPPTYQLLPPTSGLSTSNPTQFVIGESDNFQLLVEHEARSACPPSKANRQSCSSSNTTVAVAVVILLQIVNIFICETNVETKLPILSGVVFSEESKIGDRHVMMSAGCDSPICSRSNVSKLSSGCQR